MNKKCRYCDLEIEFQKSSQFGAHLTNCKFNPKKIERDFNSIQKEKFTLVCKCGQSYDILTTVYKINSGKYKKFCSRKCANSRNHSEEVRLKISEKLKLKKSENTNKKIEYSCYECDSVFSDFASKNRKFCSLSCSLTSRNKNGQAVKAGLSSSKKQARRSKNEIEFAYLCKTKFKNVQTNEPIFNGWDADIIINDIKVAILWNGNWHYKKITKNHSLKQVQNRDKIKISEIKRFGYIPYVIKDLGKFDSNKVYYEWNRFNEWVESTSKNV